MKKISAPKLCNKTKIATLVNLMCVGASFAASGPLFTVTPSGDVPVSPVTSLSITLCLNGLGALSCQDYNVPNLSLSILTTIPNHTYPQASIKVNTPGYTIPSCSPDGHGGCLFSVSDTTPALININSIQNYTITATAGPNGTVAPTSVTANYGSSRTFTATPDSSMYGVDAWQLDGNIAQYGGHNYTLSNITANHAISVSFAQATLTPSVMSLGLNVSGIARQITITNTGGASAHSVSVTPTGLPTGTVVTGTAACPISPTTGTLGAGDSCIITVTPGSTPSHGTGGSTLCTTGIAPTGSISVSASDGQTQPTINVSVLGYGCVYQGGYIYSIVDTTPNTGSIGGKVAQVISSPSTLKWANCGGSTSECTLTSAFSGINGTNTPGGNTYIIVNKYSSVSPSTYAAGLCTTVTTFQKDWYLPAICEMAYGNTTGCPNCGTQVSPTIDNIQSHLVANGNIGNIPAGGASGIYWSSTELNYNQNYACTETFSTSSPVQTFQDKGTLEGLVCSRLLTP